MTHIGFLGLGTMGWPMASNLIAAGHSLSVWTFSPGKAEQFADSLRAQHPGCSVTAVDTPSEAASSAEVTFLILGDTEMVNQACMGTGGVFEAAPKGSIVVDCSTIAPDQSVHLHEVAREHGLRFLDAPCTGSVPGAEAGALTFMIGGDDDVAEQVRPLFEILGNSIYHCGGPGLGLAAKLSQNLMLANVSQAFSEAMVLAHKAGVPAELMMEVLEHSAARTGYAPFKFPYILNRDFQPLFSLQWMTKDVSLMLDEGDRLGVSLPLTMRTFEEFNSAIADGFGDEDFCGAIRRVERQAGTELTRD